MLIIVGIITFLFSIICAKLPLVLPKQNSIINFDDIINSTSTEGVAIPFNYGGLSWQNVLVLNGVDYDIPNAGFITGAVSPKYVAFNGYGNPMSISSASGSSFTMNSFYSCAAWNDNISVEIVGKRSGDVLYRKTVALLIHTRTFVELNWSGIDSIYFNSTCKNYCDATHFTIDNLNVIL
ncbi:unnamed protein product [Adineta steineri]|uniref:Uncharacterized protein n=1 Tax=Adineta steineri TaxID=433720 RepID=A0A814K8S6_9BILA|nr:unnamed protein product [Adineta steineri]CAF3806080.1 unnamed protein product [Adineta steineri]